MSFKNPVKTLSPEVARKIAAGEVIDRPNAIIRELLDNAIDSGADKITVEIAGGGIDRIRVIDNGSGMTEEDLKNCAKPHATSKISSEEDLMNLSTLGFRGEALASIAAVSRLSITSGGYRMRASITEDHIIERTAETSGTIVQSEGLFENIPARRIFLKRPATESTMCKNTFVEKSLPSPARAFRFIADGEVKLDLPAGQTLIQRFVKASELKEDVSLFNEIKSPYHKDFSFTVIIGEPSVYRPSKKDIEIFVNGRKIQEYALVQAIEYGCQGYFPNGTYPVAAIFITISPDLVDFNIHPAKKEVRFKDMPSLHHEVSSAVRRFFLEYTQQKINAFQKKEPVKEQASLFSESKSFYDLPEANGSEINSKVKEIPVSSDTKNNFQVSANQKLFESSYEKFAETFKQNHPEIYSSKPVVSQVTYNQPEAQSKNTQEIKNFMEKAISNYTGEKIEKPHEPKTIASRAEYAATSLSPFGKNPEEKPRYMGTCLGTFIILEYKNSLFIVDQHAAHERMLFDRIMENQSQRQELLIPEEISVESEDEDKYLETIAPELEKIGFTIKKNNSTWLLVSINERWTGSSADFKKLIFEEKVQPKDIIYKIAASTACKAAVKDGSILDDNAAKEIAITALNLPDPHCPHGRPVYTVISREKLFELVRRT